MREKSLWSMGLTLSQIVYWLHWGLNLIIWQTMKYHKKNMKTWITWSHCYRRIEVVGPEAFTIFIKVISQRNNTQITNAYDFVILFFSKSIDILLGQFKREGQRLSPLLNIITHEYECGKALPPPTLLHGPNKMLFIYKTFFPDKSHGFWYCFVKPQTEGGRRKLEGLNCLFWRE